MLSRIPIIIPAYNPDKKLLSAIRDILNKSPKQIIIVVNDGSTENSNIIFETIKKELKVVLLEHAVNLGKGAALKTAFNYTLINFPDAVGAVTVDADGQHLVCDILKVQNALIENSNSLILGSRTFDRKIPLKSLLGNRITKYIFGLFVGNLISDTQTGLRGIPASFFKKLLQVVTNRYDFELEMLILACHDSDYKISEIPIETVYIDNNSSSHFNPLIDSFKIYFVFIRFIASSLFASIIDFICFSILFFINSQLLISMIIARIVSLTFNFIFNKKLVFHTKQKEAKSEVIKYMILAIIMFFLSYFGIEQFASYFCINYYVAKIIIDAVLFMFSFAVQKTLIFYTP